MPPRFLSRKSEKWRKQFAEPIEDFVHGRLGGATAGRIRRVAVHPIFGDVDIETAEIDRAELIKRVINRVKLERFKSGSTSSSYLRQALENPAIDCCSRCRWLRPAVSDRGYRIIKKIA